MREQLCPVCGCPVDENSYEKDDVFYCHESCANGGPHECGCGTVVGKEPETDK